MTTRRQPLTFRLLMLTPKLDRYHLSWDDPIELLDIYSFDFDIGTKLVDCRRQDVLFVSGKKSGG